MITAFFCMYMLSILQISILSQKMCKNCLCKIIFLTFASDFIFFFASISCLPEIRHFGYTTILQLHNLQKILICNISHQALIKLNLWHKKRATLKPPYSFGIGTITLRSFPSRFLNFEERQDRLKQFFHYFRLFQRYLFVCPCFQLEHVFLLLPQCLAMFWYETK